MRPCLKNKIKIRVGAMAYVVEYLLSRHPSIRRKKGGSKGRKEKGKGKRKWKTIVQPFPKNI